TLLGSEAPYRHFLCVWWQSQFKDTTKEVSLGHHPSGTSSRDASCNSSAGLHSSIPVYERTYSGREPPLSNVMTNSAFVRKTVEVVFVFLSRMGRRTGDAKQHHEKHSFDHPSTPSTVARRHGCWRRPPHLYLRRGLTEFARPRPATPRVPDAGVLVEAH